jgi:hypothetical protein
VPETKSGQDLLPVMLMLISLGHQQAISQELPQERACPWWLLHVVRFVDQNVRQSRRACYDEPISMEDTSRKDNPVVLHIFHHIEVGLACWTLKHDPRMANNWPKSPALWEMPHRTQKERVQYELV